MHKKAVTSISRRDFLKISSAGAVLFALSKYAFGPANKLQSSEKEEALIMNGSSKESETHSTEFVLDGCTQLHLDDAQKEMLNGFQLQIESDRIYLKNRIQPTSGKIQANKLKLLSWNIERGYFPEKIVSYINQINPDIVCLQEVDWGNERTQKLDILDYLAKQTSMLGLFGLEFYEIQTDKRTSRLAGGGVEGNAILTRIAPLSYYMISLPVLFDWQNPPKGSEKIAEREKRLGNRMAVCAEFDFQGIPITICSTHIEDKAGGVEGRFRQYEHIIKCIKLRSGNDAAIVVAGDLNTYDGWLPRLTGYSKTKESLDKPWKTPECVWWKENLLPRLDMSDPFHCNQWTFQLPFYRAKYDWITMSHAFSVSQDVGDFNSSDHRPLWAEIKLQD